MQKKGNHNRRLALLDSLRGITLISMILYHACWDAVYIVGADWPWYRSRGGFIWQQSICWTFILLSGFCVPFSQRIFRRGLEVTAAGLVVSAVTVFLMYDERVLCGVLSFLGAAMILSGILDRILLKNAVNTWTREPAEQERPSSAGGASALIGFAVCCLLFYITRWVNRGFLQLWPGRTLILPAFLFTEGIPGAILTAVGFPMKDFFSTDYFSMIPWFFLFRAGFYLHQIMRGRGWFSSPVFHCRIPLLNRMGEHSLLIYMLHQPVLYLLTLLLF